MHLLSYTCVHAPHTQSTTARGTQHPDHKCLALCQQRTPPWQHHWMCAQCGRLCKVMYSLMCVCHMFNLVNGYNLYCVHAGVHAGMHAGAHADRGECIHTVNTHLVSGVHRPVAM